MAELNIHLRISSGTVLAVTGGLILFGAAAELASENVSLATYYPAPSGIYTQMITTGRTTLARDAGGQVVFGAAATPPAQQDGRVLKAVMSDNLIVDDVYLANPRYGAPRWASRELVTVDFGAGTFSWTVPDGVTRATVGVWGAGGGGGGGGRDNGGGGGGGGGGGYASSSLSLVPGQTITVVGGAGGAGGAVGVCYHCGGGPGAAGGSSSFLGLSASGGGGGGGAFNGAAGVGGHGAGGIANSNGANGQAGTIYQGSAAGGASANGGSGGGGYGGIAYGNTGNTPGYPGLPGHVRIQY